MPGKELVPRPAVQPPAVTVPPWQQAAAGETVPAYRWIWRRRHWTVPALLLPALWTAALMLHLLGDASYVLIAGGITAAIVCAGAHLKWDRPGEQWYARASAVLAWLWLWLGSWLGPVNIWRTGALAVAVAAWGYFWWRHKRPRGHRRRQRKISKWDAWWQSHCWNWNLGGSKVADVWEMGVTTKVRVHGIAGKHSINHVRQVMDLIESGLDGYADIGMVRPEAVRGHPNWFDFYFKRENPLRQIVEYDLALAPKSVHEPMTAGMAESGSWKTISPRRNRFVIGMTRAGKSNDLLVGLAQLTGCADDRQILVDLKGGRSARPVLEAAAVDCVVTEIDEARMLLRMLVAEADARLKYAYTGDEQLLATEDVPALHVLFDEIHRLTAIEGNVGDAECRAKLALLTSQGNGVEEYVWVYTQHGSLETSVGTEQIRANLPCRTCYAVAEARHGQYVIPEYSKLDASKLEEKGTCYIKDGPKASPEQVRAPHMPHQLLKQIAGQNARQLAGRAPLRLYCGNGMAYGDVTWQQWWDSRWGRLDPAFHGISPQYQEYAAMSAARSPAEAFAAGQEIRAAIEEPEAVAATAPGEGDARSAAARIAQELEEAHRGLPADVIPPRVNLGPVIIAQEDAFATALSSAPPQGISPKQLVEESGRQRTWVHQMLGALMEAGAVTQIGRGRYLTEPGADIREALRLVQAGNDRLYREAREKIHAL